MTLPDQVDLEDFVADLEREFSSRYTDQDPDYARTETSLLEGDFNDPPILAPWRVWEPRANNNNNARGGRHGNQDRFHNNAENHRNHSGNPNRYDRNRPHHAKPYDRPPAYRRSEPNRYARGGQDRSRYNEGNRSDNNRYEGNRSDNNRYERNRSDNNRYERDRPDSNRYENRSDSNRYERNRPERGGGGARAPSAYDRRPGRPGFGYSGAGGEEERRYGHQHDTKREEVPDDSEWT